MKVLYIGDLCPHGTCRQRMDALTRLGLTVEGLDIRPTIAAGNRVIRALRLRAQIGPAVSRLNRMVLERAAALRPDLIWFDKALFIHPATVEALRGRGALLIGFTTDNPFVPACPPGTWRLVKRCIPLLDLHLVPRQCGIDDYRRAGAGPTVWMPLAFDPLHHFPRRGGDRTVPLAFIGSPHDRRADFLARMAALGQDIHISGPGWPRRADINVAGAGYWGDAYREAIWRSGMCMAFITRICRDTCAHKSFEIAACGTALLAEGSDHHAELFADGSEAALFATPEEAVDKARWYAARPEARERMALAGCRRAWTSGYSNDERLATALARIDPAMGARLLDTARSFVARRRDALGL